MKDATNNVFPSNSDNNLSSSDTSNSLESQEKLQSELNSQSQSSPLVKETPVKTSDSLQNIDWQQLAHKLREHNRKLLKKVFNLEQNLIDLTNQVKEHQEIARQEELTITEQAEKLNHSQEEIGELSQQLEKERQEIKSQQALIKNLSLQLKASQEQTAQLERQCAIVQENYNQKHYEFLSLTEQKEELESRLYRQQQQTLQYKLALEKYAAQDKPLDKLPSVKIISRLKPQPIQPWSSNNEDLAVNHGLPPLSETETNHNLVEPSSETKSLEKPHNWKAPEIVNTPKEKQPKSIATVKLPKFQRANQ